MALNIKSEEAHELARRLAEASGTSLTGAVTTALRESLAREGRTGGGRLLLEELKELQRFVAELPDRDQRTPDEILSYDSMGLPD